VDWVELHTRFLLDANEWEERGEDRSLLLGRSDLRDAEAWLARQAGKQPSPSELQVRYILASRAAATRRQRITMGSVIAALVVTAALAIFALVQRGQAINQRDQAQSRELAARSAAQLEADPEQSLRLAVRSAETARTSQTEAALQDALAESHVRLALQTPPAGSGSPILASDVTPDGRLAVTGHGDGQVRLWDLRGGRRLATLRGQSDPVTSVDVSPNGALAVTASRITSSGDGEGTARVWELPSGRLLTKLTSDSEGLGNAVFSPDSLRIVTTTEVDSFDPARIWDSRTGKLLHEIGPPGETDFATWTPDGRRIATIDLGGVKMWETSSGTMLRRFRIGGDQFPVAADFSPDGSLLAVAGDGVGFIARVATGELTPLPGRHDLFNALTSVRFCPSGACVITTSDDNTAQLWSVSGRELATLSGHTANVSAASFSEDGHYLLTESEDSTARLWSPRSGALLAVLRGHQGEITGAHLLGGTRILTTSSDGTGRVWDPGVVVLQGHRDWLNDARFSPNGTEIATASVDGTARLWSADGTLRRTLKPRDDFSGVETISFNSDGTRLLMEQDTESLWTRDGDQLRNFGFDVDYSTFIPGSPLVAAPGPDDVLLFDTQRGSPRGRLRVGPAGDRQTPGIQPEFSRDGRLVAAPGTPTTRVWNMREPGRSLDLRTPEYVDKVAFSPDGTRLVTAGDSAHVVRIWDIGASESAVLDRYPGGVRDVAFSPDGRLVLSVSAGERSVRVHDAETLRRVQVLRHENEVFQASFDRRSRLVLTAGDADTAHLWDARSGRLIATVAGHSDTVDSARFSTDGGRIVTSSDDFTAVIHDCDECLPYDDLLDLAHKRVTPLSEGE
jgi:WD40 repeat protein